jgi:hypothetical protein
MDKVVPGEMQEQQEKLLNKHFFLVPNAPVGMPATTPVSKTLCLVYIS